MLSKKKILVVEDSPVNRTILRSILSPHYIVLESENGQDALAFLSSCKEEISLILLDINMPVMDGYTFLSLIKKDPALAAIPVIVSTQNDAEEDEVAALAYGAADFTTKPYKPQIILHRIANIINLRETAAMVNLLQYDRLTGMYSKGYFYQSVKTILEENPDKEYFILCSNIENFKLINDTFGVAVGDELLRQCATLCKKTVGKLGICARFEADIFVCLLERSIPYTNELFKDLCAQVNTLTVVKNIVVRWGIYTVGDDSVSVEQMCDRALLAVRSIKGQYNRYFTTYNDELRTRLLQEQSIIDSMESALNEGQFEIYLQPKYRIRDEKLLGAEALVRWNHPQWGLVSPATFIPLFERNGFISKLDRFVWEQTCACLHQWDLKGYAHLPVSVNVSRADIYHTDLAKVLTELTQKYELAPARLHLEITESAYTENPDQIVETIIQLRQLGFIIEMDDFGSGYSSLNMLNRMPLDILKLDMQFMQYQTVRPINQEILRFIMELARWMNLRVVAEGVETREQLDRLREIGCDYAQGYYFAKPIPVHKFEELLTQPSTSIERIAFSQNNISIAHRIPIVLVADEDIVYRNSVRSTFEGKYQVIEASDGETALACINRYEQRIAVVLLSLTLSEPDGFAILEAMQCKTALQDIPVIATAQANAQLEEQALEFGATDFAGKPHSPKSLWRRTLRILSVRALQERDRILRDKVYHDSLTALLNQRGLAAAIKLLNEADCPFTVYLFDVDELQQINRTWGHTVGDQLLTMFTTILHTYTRGSDILARTGGDEFLVILKRFGTEENAQKKGNEICQATKNAQLLEEKQFTCTAGAAIGTSKNNILEIINRAKQAFLLAKVENRGSCRLWQSAQESAEHTGTKQTATTQADTIHME